MQQRELGRKLAERGWNYPLAPKEYGGGGLDVDRAIILEEEADRFDLTLPPYYDSGGRLGSASILVWGSEEQKRELLPPIYKGEVRTWQLLSEPGAGSDLAGVQTQAVRDGDDYVINGQKVFVGSDNGCERIWMIAVTDPEGKRHENVSWFMVDAALPGITMAPLELMGTGGEGGADSGQKQSVWFDNVRVPAKCLVGGENRGWEVATTHLELEHGGSGRIGRNRLWERLLKHCQEHTRDGKPLTEDADVRDLLADIYIKGEVTRLFGLRNYWLTYAQRPRSYEGPRFLLSQSRRLVDDPRNLETVGPIALLDDDEGAQPTASWRTSSATASSPSTRRHPDIQSITMARRIGIGRAQREAAGTVVGGRRRGGGVGVGWWGTRLRR
jgi:alkylation response protein AidB-like acyl-CoA dehydrogenase